MLVVDRIYINQALAKMPEIAPIQQIITPVNEVDHHFTCCICQYLVWNPQQCSVCEVLICTDCITQNKKHSDTCPKCRNIFNTSKLSRFTTNKLNEIKLNCKGCNKPYSYENAQRHMECNLPELLCVLECGKHSIIKTR